MRRKITVLGATAAAVMLALSVGVVSAKRKPKPPSPPPTPANPAIAFTHDDQVFVMNADGSNVTLVAAEGVDSHCVAVDWSPDGNWIVWVPSARPGFRIAKAHPDGTGYTVLLAVGAYEPGSAYGYNCDDVRWSPGDVLGTGEKIAFGVYGQYGAGVEETHLFLMDTDGGNVVDLTEVSGGPLLVIPGFVAWSPTADCIAAVDAGGHIVVLQLGLDADGQIKIVQTSDITQAAWDYGSLDFLSGDHYLGSAPISIRRMDWAHTQDRLVVAYANPGIYDPIGSAAYVLELVPPYGVQLLTTLPEDAHHTVGGVAWSPDDSMVAVAFPTGYQKWQKLAGIWLLDPSDGADRVKVMDESAGSLEWWAGAGQ